MWLRINDKMFWHLWHKLLGLLLLASLTNALIKAHSLLFSLTFDSFALTLNKLGFTHKRIDKSTFFAFLFDV